MSRCLLHVPAPQRPDHAAKSDEAPKLLPLLVSRKLLTPEQAERARRVAEMKQLTDVQAVIQLGLINEDKLTETMAAAAGLEFVHIDPLDSGPRRCDERAPRPLRSQARARRDRQNRRRDHDRSARPLRALPARRHPASDRRRRGAGGGAPHRCRARQQELLRPPDEPEHRGEATARRVACRPRTWPTRSSSRPRQTSWIPRPRPSSKPSITSCSTPSSSAPRTSTSSRSAT